MVLAGGHDASRSTPDDLMWVSVENAEAEP